MKSSRPVRRSVSPFGTVAVLPVDPYSILKIKLLEKFPEVQGKPALHQFSDLAHLPHFLDIATQSVSHDKIGLEQICEFLVQFRNEIFEAGLLDDVFAALEVVFYSKVDDFLITHYDQTACEKMGWSDVSRDVIINSRERDMMVGRFFIPFTEPSPGQFSSFLSRWIQSERPDVLLHFLDFCRGSNNPTFEYFLAFSDPGFHRILTNKPLLRGIFNKGKILLSRISSPTWEVNVRTSLSL